LQWLENHGDVEFEFHRIGQMDGAYAPTSADMDGDGDLDIVTVAEFAFWDKPETRSVVWWEQIDDMQFVPHTIAHSPTHLVTCDVADLDGNGLPEIVAGGMALYPPFDRITRVALWNNAGSNSEIRIDASTYPDIMKRALEATDDSGTRGMILHANGFDPRNEYATAMENEPAFAKWPYFIGLLEMSVGDSSSALAHFEHAQSLDNEYAPLQTRLGELYVGVGDTELATEKFKKADTPYSKVALAQLEAEQQNWDEVLHILKDISIPAATSLIRMANAKMSGQSHVPFVAVDMGYQMNDPWLAELEAQCLLAPLLVTQAQTDFIAGDIDSAERLLRRAILLDSTNKDARLALANILLRNDRLNAESLNESLMHLEAGMQADPTYVMTRAKFGWALYLSQRFEEARAVWLSILEEEPKHGPVLSNLAQLEFVQNNYQQAYVYYSKALAIPEDSPFAISGNEQLRSATLYRFALVAKQVNRVEEALQALQLAVVYFPSDATAQFELGNTYISLQQFAEALTHVELANALQPNNPRILAALGYTWFNLGDTARAAEFLEQAVQIAPTFALAWYHLGNAQIAQGNINAAKESFSMAIQLQPTFTLAKEALLAIEGR